MCQSEKVAPWHFTGSSQLLGQYFSSGGETNDLQIIDLVVVIGKKETMLESKVPEVQPLARDSHPAINCISVTAT